LPPIWFWKLTAAPWFASAESTIATQALVSTNKGVIPIAHKGIDHEALMGPLRPRHGPRAPASRTLPRQPAQHTARFAAVRGDGAESRRPQSPAPVTRPTPLGQAAPRQSTPPSERTHYTASACSTFALPRTHRLRRPQPRNYRTLTTPGASHHTALYCQPCPASKARSPGRTGGMAKSVFPLRSRPGRRAPFRTR